VDTLTALRAELPPATPLVLLLGADALLGLTTWHQWPHLFDLAHLTVAHRPGFPAAAWEDALPDELRRQLARRRTDQAGDLSTQPAGHIYLQSITQLDISATRIRERALRGQSLAYLLPDPVIDYIQEHHLYV
jgi:nicotinate-nucleotide adenylyltransferase